MVKKKTATGEEKFGSKEKLKYIDLTIMRLIMISTILRTPGARSAEDEVYSIQRNRRRSATVIHGASIPPGRALSCAVKRELSPGKIPAYTPISDDSARALHGPRWKDRGAQRSGPAALGTDGRISVPARYTDVWGSRRWTAAVMTNDRSRPGGGLGIPLTMKRDRGRGNHGAWGAGIGM